MKSSLKNEENLIVTPEDVNFTDLERLSKDAQECEDWVNTLTEEQKFELQTALEDAPRVGPQPGPQMDAFNSEADVLGYGGAAGGGKTALIAMLALLSHQRTVIFRRDGKELIGLMDELVKFSGSEIGLNRQSGVFRMLGGRLVEFGGLGNPGDEQKWRGREHDLVAVDEATEIRGDKFRYLLTWMRSSTRGQRCRALLTFNPPGGPDDPGGDIGRWIIEYFAPWLDPRHDNPAIQGELRYFVTDSDGLEREVEDDTPVRVEVGGEAYWQKPQSRTFIQALVSDNAYLKGTGYVDTLLSLPEPHRSRMLRGEFTAGVMDDEYQVLPTRWVDKAMQRWTEEKRAGNLEKYRREDMSSIGVDVARSGRDHTILARRHDWFWDELVEEPTRSDPHGRDTMAFVLQHVRDGAWICIDAGSVGASPYDYLREAVGTQCIAIQGQARKSLPQIHARDTFFNLRAVLYWTLRKVLDPDNGLDPLLPDDRKLRTELLSVRFTRSRGPVLVEKKDEIKARLGYSPDRADAVVYSLMKIGDTEGAHRILRSAPPIDRDKLRIRQPRPVAGSTWMGM